MLNWTKILLPDPSDHQLTWIALGHYSAPAKAAVITPVHHVYFHKAKDWLNWIEAEHEQICVFVWLRSIVQAARWPKICWKEYEKYNFS